MTTRKSLLTETLDNENKMIALVKEYDEKGEGDKIPKKVRERYDTIMKNMKSMKNHYDDYDYDDVEMKEIEKVTMQNRSASRKARNPPRRGGKTKRKRRNKKSRKRKN